jgi:hypothetical protein
MNTTVPFCMGPGRVMMAGFQVAFGGQPVQPCMLFLFMGFVVNTPVKYVFAIIVSFLMGFMNEGFGLMRKRLSAFLSDKSQFLTPIVSVIYGFQMVNAYWMMLLVMTYEALIFTSLIFGLFLGNVVFNLRILQGKAAKCDTTLIGGTTPCCHSNESQPLLTNDSESKK